MPNIAAMLLDRGAAGGEVAPPCTPLPITEIRPTSPLTPRQAWVRLALALVIGSIGSVGMWSVVVVLPVVQAEFGATRGAVSLAYTLTMLGFGLGGVVDRADHRSLRHRGGDGGSASPASARPTCSPDFRPRCGNSSRCIS